TIAAAFHVGPGRGGFCRAAVGNPRPPGSKEGRAHAGRRPSDPGGRNRALRSGRRTCVRGEQVDPRLDRRARDDPRPNPRAADVAVAPAAPPRLHLGAPAAGDRLPLVARGGGVRQPVAGLNVPGETRPAIPDPSSTVLTAAAAGSMARSSPRSARDRGSERTPRSSAPRRVADVGFGRLRRSNSHGY